MGVFCHIAVLFLREDYRWKEQSFEAISIDVGDDGTEASFLCTASTYSWCTRNSCRLGTNSIHFHFTLEIAHVKRGKKEKEDPPVACENPSYLKKCVEL